MTPDAPVRLAASPINWHNDDFPILGSDTWVDSILGGMQAAGYAGTELGSQFPTTRAALAPLLDHYELELAGGWFSAYLLTRDKASELARFAQFVDFLHSMGTRICTIAEASYCPFKPYPPSAFDQHYPSLAVPLFPYQLPQLTPDQWRSLGSGLEELSDVAAARGIALGYHPHMQTVVQSAEHVNTLAEAAPRLQFTIDTGHLRFAGADELAILESLIDRTVHLHIKNVRDRVADAARAGSMPFAFAVTEGCFTVPGDGGIDFVKVFDVLKRHGYQGWMVVEAEQNPETSDPVLYATLAREYIRNVAGW
jgi:inosose dehydratase